MKPKKKKISQLKEEDKFHFLSNNSKIRKKNKKLNYIKVELFFIKVRKGTISYKFTLYKNTKRHFIFYVLLLELVDLKTLI